MAQRWFWSGTALLLVILATVQIFAALGESQTWDEGIEIASGYYYLKTGNYQVIREHPPLARVVAALPLVAFLPPLKLDQEFLDKNDSVGFGTQFLYHSNAPPKTILFLARLTVILATICVGLALALWVRAEFGAAAALFALALFSFDPTVIAHGHYAKNDMLAALFSLLAGASWINYLRAPRWKSLVLAGIFLGLAIGTKFSSGFLVPVFVLLALVQPRRIKNLGALVLVGAISFAAIALIYAPYVKDLVPTTLHQRQTDPTIQQLRTIVDRRTAIGETLFWVGKNLGLRAHPFFDGINQLARHNSFGHPAYLLGTTGTGWWYYFPVAFAVKTPLATLLILAAAVGAALFRWRTPTLAPLLAFISVLVFLAMSMLSNINIGIRHLLPMYPFLFALLGAAMARWNPRIAVIACALVAAESLAMFPNYTAFFNVAAGGPGNGPKYLLDSNLDWGQDLPKLKSWLDAHHEEKVCMLYFGTAELGAYGITRGVELPNEWNTEGREKMDCYAAASATPLFGLYTKPGEFDYLLQSKPVGKVGYSIYVYDFRKSR